MKLKRLLLVIIAAAALTLLGMPTWIATPVVVVGMLVLGSAIVVKHRRDIKSPPRAGPEQADGQAAQAESGATAEGGAGEASEAPAESDEPAANSAGTPDPR